MDKIADAEAFFVKQKDEFLKSEKAHQEAVDRIIELSEKLTLDTNLIHREKQAFWNRANYLFNMELHLGLMRDGEDSSHVHQSKYDGQMELMHNCSNGDVHDRMTCIHHVVTDNQTRILDKIEPYQLQANSRMLEVKAESKRIRWLFWKLTVLTALLAGVKPITESILKLIRMKKADWATIFS